MSLRFEARVLADCYSAYVDADTRGAPVAQSKSAKVRTVIGNATDAALGAAAVALYENDAARTAIAMMYLARGGLAAVGAYFSGFEIRITGAGGGSRDPNVVAFNRQRRIASAMTNFAVGTALLTMVAGREAALASCVKGNVDNVVGPLVARLTAPTEASIDELVSVIANPKSDRHLRVAVSDLDLLGEAALPALAQRLVGATDTAGVAICGVIKSLAYFARDGAAGTAIAEAAVKLLEAGDSYSVRRASDVLYALNESMVKALPKELGERLAAAERVFANRAVADRDAVAARNEVGYAVAHALGGNYTPAYRLFDTLSSDLADVSTFSAKVLAKGQEAVPSLRDKIASLIAEQADAENAAYILARLETMPMRDAFEGLPRETSDDTHFGEALKSMRGSGNVNRFELTRAAERSQETKLKLETLQGLLAKLDVGGSTSAEAT